VAEQPSGESSLLRTLASPLRLSETPVRTHRGAPAFGGHTEEVLREAGLGAAEIQGMREAGVVQ
jgi:crotonobetainyl-CoA:carnitine CoA-transferase CaiB-like acyl-CoA transferase